MIPPITPPTDNLYKFISLFGLTILLFSVYNLGITYDQSAKNKMKIEDVKMDLQQMIFTNSGIISEQPSTDGAKRFHPAMIKRMTNDLDEIEATINASNLDPVQTIKVKGEVSKVSVALDTLRVKQWGYISFGIIGFALMVGGFARWHTREQKFRDKILTIEHAIKVLEKVHYTGRKVKKHSVPSVEPQPVYTTEMPDVNLS